jgi:peptidoglycan/xylan/chitin deacetylase (PgdA/CDA1 family)
MNATVIRLIEALYRASCFLCYFSGLYFLVSYLKRNKPVILMYHSINHHNSPNIYPDNIVGIENFEKQIEYLSQKRNIISLEELIGRIEQGFKFSPYTTAITFDDGYYDFFLNAYPILRKHHAPATVFLITGFLDSGGGKWEDRLAFLINMTHSSPLGVDVDGRELLFKTSTGRERAQSIRELQSILQGLSEDKMIKALGGIEKTIGHKQDFSPLITLRRSEITLMKDDPLISFGAHTHSHQDLGKTNDKTAKSEIKTSREEIEKITGKKCLLFSYPFGKRKNLNPQVKAMLKAQDFIGAVTAIPGANNTDSELFELKRIAVTDSVMVEFKCALIGLTLQRP